MAGEQSEHLMLVGDDRLEIDVVEPVYLRHERKIEAAFVVGHMPRAHEVEALPHLVCRHVFQGDTEIDTPKLVGDTIEEEHVLRSCARVAEAIAEVEADSMAVLHALRHAPVPRVVTRPHAAAPIEQAECRLRVERVVQAAYAERTHGPHGDDLLVVIERGGVFCPRCRNDHGITRLVIEDDFGVQRLAVLEVVELDVEQAGAFGNDEAHLCTLVLVACRA